MALYSAVACAAPANVRLVKASGRDGKGMVMDCSHKKRRKLSHSGAAVSVPSPFSPLLLKRSGTLYSCSSNHSYSLTPNNKFNLLM